MLFLTGFLLIRRITRIETCSGLYGLLAMGVYVVAVLGVVMVRDQGLAWRFEQELGTATRERQSLLDVLERRLGPAGEPLVKRIQLDNPARRENVRQRVDAAGRPGGLTVERYARRKGAFLVIGHRPGAVRAAVGGAGCRRWRCSSSGPSGSTRWLHGTARRRRGGHRARPPRLPGHPRGLRELPASPSVRRWGAWPRPSDGPLREEMQLVLRQIAAGRPAARGLRRAAPAQHLRRHRQRSSRPSSRPRTRRAAHRRAGGPRARHAPIGLPARPASARRRRPRASRS